MYEFIVPRRHIYISLQINNFKKLGTYKYSWQIPFSTKIWTTIPLNSVRAAKWNNVSLCVPHSRFGNIYIFAMYLRYVWDFFFFFLWTNWRKKIAPYWFRRIVRLSSEILHSPRYYFHLFNFLFIFLINKENNTHDKNWRMQRVNGRNNPT